MPGRNSSLHEPRTGGRCRWLETSNGHIFARSNALQTADRHRTVHGRFSVGSLYEGTVWHLCKSLKLNACDVLSVWIHRHRERDIEYLMESLISELKNFQAMTDFERRELDVASQVSILVSSTEPQTTGKSSLSGVLGEIMKDQQFRSLRVEECKYSEKDRTAEEGNDARPMAILVGDEATDTNVLARRLKEKLGPQFTTSILPGLGSSRSHAIYARKLFFDESKPERFLCLLLVMPYE